MKVALLIAFVVLELLMETAMAQSCIQPTCRRGARIDTNNCQCNGYTDSTCPSGFKPIVDEHGHCSCEGRTQPTCKKDFSLNRYACKCEFIGPLTCPDGSSVSPPSDSVCKGEHVPYCPSGYIKHGCECVKKYVRRCSSGTLSNNGCKCSSTYSPTCYNGCRLDNRRCTCESNIKCFNNLYCSGYGRTVNSVSECCLGIGIGFDNLELQPSLDAEISSISHSYRIGGGDCNRCYH